MTILQGVSNEGTLLTLGHYEGLDFAYSVTISSEPLPPQRRIGYFWVYAFLREAPFTSYMLERGAVYAPGVYVEFPKRFIGLNFALRADTIFDESGLPYIISLI